MKFEGTIIGIRYDEKDASVKLDILRDDGGVSILSVTAKQGKKVKINERISVKLE